MSTKAIGNNAEMIVVSRQWIVGMQFFLNDSKSKIERLQRINKLFFTCIKKLENVIEVRELFYQKRLEGLSKKIQHSEKEIQERYQEIEHRLKEIERLSQIKRRREMTQESIRSRSWSASEDSMPESISDLSGYSESGIFSE
jgi:cell division protein FtsL